VNTRMRTSDVGRHVFGAAAIIFGVAGLIWGDFASNWQPVRSVPYHTALAYLAAVSLLGAGIAVQWRRTARVALLVLAFWYLIFAGFWAPRVILLPRIAGTWSGFAEQFCLVVAAMMAYVTLSDGNEPWTDAALRVGRMLFGLCLISFGVVHFEALKQTADMVPSWLPPNQRFWAAATGVAHLLAGVAIVTGVQALLAARLQTAMFLGFGLLVWLPSFIAKPTAHNVWGGNAMNLAAVGAAWIVVDILGARAVVRRERSVSDVRVAGASRVA
jgi:uncharacterized membrane protein YphA (DoxX/SURF4 family)